MFLLGRVPVRAARWVEARGGGTTEEGKNVTRPESSARCQATARGSNSESEDEGEGFKLESGGGTKRRGKGKKNAEAGLDLCDAHSNARFLGNVKQTLLHVFASSFNVSAVVPVCTLCVALQRRFVYTMSFCFLPLSLLERFFRPLLCCNPAAVPLLSPWA